MKTTTLGSLGKIIISIVATITTIAAQEGNNNINSLSYNEIYVMSTEELQKKVEEHSQNGNLSFVLGQELIKRWTKS